MYDALPGQPYTPKFRILDSNGSPVLSGVTGTISLFGPASTTALVSGSTLVHQGDGYWGASFAGSNLASPGTYRWVTSALTSGITWAAQAGTFTVGMGDWWSLRELYTSLRRRLRDGWTGTTDTDGNVGGTTLVCSRFAYGSDNAWLSSEIFIFEQLAPIDANPLRVTAFTKASGTFTCTPALSGKAVAGIDFIVGNKDGQRWSHDEVLEALTTAIRRMRTMRPVSDQVAIATSPNTWEYSLPAGWATVDQVLYQPQGGAATLWVPLARPFWRYRQDRALLTLDYYPSNCAIRVEGRAFPRLPERMPDLVPADGATLRDDALYDLLMRGTNEDKQQAAMLAGPVLRARAGQAFARM